jgi:flagellar motor switch protein FliM
LIEAAANVAAPGRPLAVPGLERILGQPLTVRIDGVAPARPDRPRRAGAEVVLLEHAASGAHVAVELAPEAALDFVRTALTTEPWPEPAAARPLDEVERGVLLYLVARATCALAGIDAPVRVAGPGDDGDAAAAEEGGVTARLTLRFGGQPGHAWLHVPPRLAAAVVGARAPAPPGGTAARLDALPAALHVVAGRAVVTTAQIRSARPGDALLLDEVWVAPGDGGAFGGRVRLRLPQGSPRWVADLGPDGAVVVGERLEQEGTMTDLADDRLPHDAEALLDEIPVELSVELGRVLLTALQAVGLRPGLSLRLGRRPGDLVDLRVGPKLVARGELVLIEGEVGVLLRETFAPALDPDPGPGLDPAPKS